MIAGLFVAHVVVSTVTQAAAHFAKGDYVSSLQCPLEDTQSSIVLSMTL